MLVGGFLKQSLIDYPGKIASVIFTTGCNFRCFYCHNPELVLPELIEKNPPINFQDILSYLNKNKQLLDAVVVSGGEPTLHTDLPKVLRNIKDLGLSVKLDTNGTNPRMIKKLINNALVDYIAMDVKATLSVKKYQETVGEDFSFTMMDRIMESIQILNNSDIQYEFRTTVVKPYHTTKDILDISNSIKGNYFIQTFRDDKTLNKELKYSGYTEPELENVLNNQSKDLEIQLRN